MREFADCRRLAGAIHADCENHERFVRGGNREWRFHCLHQSKRRLLEQLARGCARRAAIGFAHLVEQPLRGVDADVAGQESRLELFDGGFIERTRA